MAIFKCKMCGADLNVTEEIKIMECDFCGTSQTVAAADSEKKITLFNRANRLRMMNDFDKAAGIYESIIAEFPEEAEAYWGLCLCKYGIEYVDDPATGNKIPTCHRSSFESIMDDSDFEQVMEYADALTRKVYRDEAKQIEEIRKGIIAVSANEEPYDIFICYKETAENGDRTLDSVIAQDVYDELTGKGYRVFFSRITLEDKLGVEYEPYIFAALNSAKIMLVFGTDYEYFNAVWVKNEWSRYLKLMATDKTKHLIPCYKGVDAYDMPKEFAKLQAQDMGKVGATQDLMRGIEKILPKNNNSVAAPAAVQTVAASANPSIDSYLKRVFIFLADGDFKSADEYCEKVLDIDPENAQAYLGKLMAELHVCKQEELKNQPEPFDLAINYAKVKRYGDDTLISAIDSYIEHIKQALIEKEQRRIEQVNLSKTVQNLFSISTTHSAFVKSDGTVVAIGDNEYGQCKVKHWTDVVAVSVAADVTVGLKADGTVIASGDTNNKQLDPKVWNELTAVSAGGFHIAGLKSNGTVVAVGSDSNGKCDVSNWGKIIEVVTGTMHTVGLKSNGTVVAVGYNEYGQCDVGDWTDIVSISAGNGHTVGLKSDGTVVAVGDGRYGQCSVSDWKDIVAISAKYDHTVGLKSDGTVVTAGKEYCDYSDVSNWTSIIAIAAGSGIIGLKSDGTLVAAGDNEYGECNVSGVRLFIDIDSLQQEREENMHKARIKAEEQRKKVKEKRQKAAEDALKKQGLRAANLCQHCGGEFKGLFTKKCVRCGKPKDY